MEKQCQQATIEQEKCESETPRQKTEFEQQIKLVEGKRQADSDAYQRDIEVRRLETQRVLYDQR